MDTQFSLNPLPDAIPKTISSYFYTIECSNLPFNIIKIIDIKVLLLQCSAALELEQLACRRNRALLLVSVNSETTTRDTRRHSAAAVLKCLHK